MGLQWVFAKEGTANATILPVEHGKFFRQSFFITLINSKAIVFAGARDPWVGRRL